MSSEKDSEKKEAPAAEKKEVPAKPEEPFTKV